MGNLSKLDDPRPTAVRWRIVALLMAFSFMNWFNRISMPAAGDLRIMKQYDISEEVMGTIYSVFLLTYTLCMTPGGWFIDRFGPWRALMLMGFGSALFGALTGLPGLGIRTTWLVILALLLVRGLMGACSAPLYPGSGRMVSHWIPFRQRAWANSLVTSAALVGIAFTYFLFGFLIDQWDWPAAFLITGVVTGLLALAWTIDATNYPS